MPVPARLLLLAAAAWILPWTLVFAIHAHRSYIGRLGYAEWTPRAANTALPPAERKAAADMAAFEMDIALQAEPWLPRAALLGLAPPLLLAGGLWASDRRRRRTTRYATRVLSRR